MDIIVLLPKGLCSQMQELQMTTVIEENVHVFAGLHFLLDDLFYNIAG